MGQAASSPTPAAPPPSASHSSSPDSRPTPEPTTRRHSSWRRSLLPSLAERQPGGAAAALAAALSSNAHSGDNPSAEVQQQQELQGQEQERPQNHHNHDSYHSHRSQQPRNRPRRARSASINRLSQFLRHDDMSNDNLSTDADNGSADGITMRRPSRLQRARTSLNASVFNLSNISFRRSPPATPGRLDTPNSSAAAALDFNLPNVPVNDDMDINFDDLTTTVSAGRPATPRTPSRRSSIRLPNGLSDRLSGLRSDRATRSFPTRRRSPLEATAGAGPGQGGSREGLGGAGPEDNTALLSRLLSVAAAATAATLLEGNQQAIADARSVAGDGDDGTFNSFLQSLESGRLAAALRGAGQNGDDNTSTSPHAPLNFFRMFRFGSPGAPTSAGAAANASSANNSSDATTPPSSSSPSPDAGPDGRMVPIIIVGIRSVNPASGSNPDDNGMPPFLDALSALPTTPFGENPVDHDSIDNILRSPQNGTHFTHRRRASMGGVNSIASGYDAQRHHRSPERAARRHMPMATERPTPPSSSAQTFSRVASPASSTSAASRPSSLRTASRRESIIRTTTTTTLETTSEDAPLRPRAPRQRRLSESDYRSTFSSRRNGIVEPDNPAPPSENTRSWIIYVLGGSYPENHPILTTPSLFTDSPTYEDMMLLSALLGPAKPPVASESDVAGAGGIYKIETIPQGDHGVTLVAVAVDQSERVELVDEQRCLVCLCDFEADEEARQLIKCKHLFHKECIDEWLTKGRNSCPLCRGQGVDEKDKTPASTAQTPGEAPATSANTSSSASFVDAAPSSAT